MTEAFNADEIEQQFSAVSQRISRAIGDGHRTIARTQYQRRTSRQVVDSIPQENRDSVIAAVRWAIADAERHRDPVAAREADHDMAARGYTGPQTTERPSSDTDLDAARAARTAQLSGNDAATLAAREEAETPRMDAGNLRDELARDDHLTADARAGVLAGVALSAAIDDEALAAATTGPNTAGPGTELGAATSLDPAQSVEPGAELVGGGERTASIAELLEATNPRSVSDLLNAPAASAAAGHDPAMALDHSAGVEADNSLGV